MTIPHPLFDEYGRFVLADYAARPPFASFLPGIAGLHGIPLWALYVNRGQAIASFGLENKDGAILEYQPANKAYRQVALTGFRTFIKLEGSPVEPFSALTSAPRWMRIGMNELEIEETPVAGLAIRVNYFILPNEPVGALVRQVNLINHSTARLSGELLDGLATVVPYGVSNTMLKGMSRTAEAWMDVFNRREGVPFFRARASLEDKPEVQGVEAGHFYLAFAQDGIPLPMFVDPEVVFGQDSALVRAQGFLQQPLDALQRGTQHPEGRTPCAFAGASFRLEPGESFRLHALAGHAAETDAINARVSLLARGDFLDEARSEARRLTAELTDPVDTHTGLPLFDAYCRQTLLDNILRGGKPELVGDSLRPRIYHIYSRKHGDLERDYNDFFQSAEPYSHGSGNYRDVNQNRRTDVLIEPRIADYNLHAFVDLIQADGYNPLVVDSPRWFVPFDSRAALLTGLQDDKPLQALLKHPFTPGELETFLRDPAYGDSAAQGDLFHRVLEAAEERVEASFGEGYWVDHWTYNLDLIESYLSIYPEHKVRLLFQDATFSFYDSPVVVQPRTERYVLVDGAPRQSNALRVDEEKRKLIASRTDRPHLARLDHGTGDVFHTTLFVKLITLAAVKFATLDPSGLGIEMEAGRPGWYDALNGLPGLFGSSFPETCELLRLVDFLRAAIAEGRDIQFGLPIEVYLLLTGARREAERYAASDAKDRDLHFWQGMADERERFRERVRLGFNGRVINLSAAGLDEALAALRIKLEEGIERAVKENGGIAPTYWTHTMAGYKFLRDERGEPRRDAQGHPYIHPVGWKLHPLPLFLEGPVHWLKLARAPEQAREMHARIQASELYDARLRMYKVNASLAEQPQSIGRARAFTPGWLENESIWLHMEYKYLLELLRAGLHEEFFSTLRDVLIPFQDPEVYGRNPIENSSFLVSSAHPNASLWGRGFMARLSGSTAEFLSIRNEMMAGRCPFGNKGGELSLQLVPTLPGWLFSDQGEVSFNFLGLCAVTYHNPARRALLGKQGPAPVRMVVQPVGGAEIALDGGVITHPLASHVREGRISAIHVYYEAEA